MELQTLIETLSAYGPNGLIIALVVLVAIFAAKKFGVVATSDQARLANVALAAILSGLADDPSAEKAIVALIASLVSALIHTGLVKIGSLKPAG